MPVFEADGNNFLDIWKKYEIENEKNKEILLPETLEFDWFICD